MHAAFIQHITLCTSLGIAYIQYLATLLCAYTIIPPIQEPIEHNYLSILAVYIPIDNFLLNPWHTRGK